VPITTVMLATGTPKLARYLLAAAAVSFVAVVVRDGFGVGFPLWEAGWSKSYNVTEFLGVTVCGLRAVHASGRERAAWIALTLGLLGYFAGDVYYTVVITPLGEIAPFPSPADAGYLAIYPGAYVALVLLLRARAGRIPATLWLDGLISALGLTALGAALVFGVVASTEGSFAAVATNLAYPLGDLALLAFVIGVVTVSGWRAGRTWMLIAAGFGLFAAIDTIYLYQAAVGTYVEDRLLDAGWPAAYVLAALAAWQPQKHIDARRLRGGAMLVLPAGSALASLGLLLLDHYVELNDLAMWMASASLVAVVVRFALTFRANLRMLRESEDEATTDALTGLGNRRALVRDLERAADETGGETHVLALFDLDGFKSYNDAFGHPAGDALLERLGANLASTIDGFGTAYRMGGDEFCVLARVAAADAEAVIAGAAAALSERGERFRVSCSYGTVTLEGETLRAAEALRVADQRMYANKRGGRPTNEETIHQVLLSVVGEHDGALRDHVDDVADLAERVSRELGLDDVAAAHVRRAAALHDVGKVAIPDEILHAPRKLTEDEWVYMRQHTIIGARIIGAAPELLPVAEIVRSSHERYDGAGYPDQLAGEEIPLGARIVAVCDSFDAMTTTRAYREAMSVSEALDELERCAGTQFDPRVVAAFRMVLAGAAVAVA
jgi:two-component system cell cycle response regulator